MGTGAKVILLPVVSLLGVPAEMLMFPSDIRLLAGSPGAPDPVLPLGPFATTGAKPILGKAGAPVHAELLDEAQEATLWLPPSRAMVHGRAAAPEKGQSRCFPSPRSGIQGKLGIISTKSRKHKTCSPFLWELDVFWPFLRHPCQNFSQSATQAHPPAVWEMHLLYK